MTTLRRGATVCGVELLHPTTYLINTWVVTCGCGEVCFASIGKIWQAVTYKWKLCCPSCATGDDMFIARYRDVMCK